MRGIKISRDGGKTKTKARTRLRPRTVQEENVIIQTQPTAKKNRQQKTQESSPPLPPPTLPPPLHTNAYLGVFFAVVALLRLRLLDNAVEQLPSRAKLCDEVDEAVVLVDVVQLDDARVVHAPKNLDLAPQTLDATHLALFDRLDRVALAK